MDGDREAALQSFINITGAETAQALGLLEATSYNLEQAVDLFFNPDAGFGQTDEQLAQQLSQQHGVGGQGASNGVVPQADDDVRAAIPTKIDRLYGDVDYYSRLRSNAAAQPHEVSAFRDFEAEGSGLSGSRRKIASKNSLAGMFEPPRDLMFEGDFEHAKAEAEKRSVWLLVNVQSNTEFASHQLNRDTWGDEAVQSIIKGSFLFWQVYDSASEGGKVVAYYKLYELPAILVIDPITGGVVRTFTGFMHSERLVEELVPFMDHNIHDPEAHRLSSAHQKRKLSAPQVEPSRPSTALTEDEELEMALAMSVEAAAPPSKRSADAPSTSGSERAQGGVADDRLADDRLAEAALPSTSAQAQVVPEVVPQKSPVDLQAEAAASLPPEPNPSTSSLACRVAVRLPSGDRKMRAFLKSSPLSVLRTLCLASSPEAAAGRPFSLVQTRPGAPALGNMSQSLEDAGVVGALVNMVWS